MNNLSDTVNTKETAKSNGYMKLSVIEFGTPKERIIKYVSLDNIYELIRNCSLVRERGKILGNKEIVISNGCEKKYSLEQKSDSYHIFGSGGENVFYNLLMRDNEPVLMSMQHLSYDSLSDDSEDHTTRTIRRTELLDEKDELAKLVFEEIKRINI